MNETAETQPEPDYPRIGGWLILVGIGVVLSPFAIVIGLAPMYLDLFRSGAVEVLTTPGTEVYHPLWAPYIYGEIAINAALVLMWGYLAFLFFRKKREFPGLYIFMLVFQLGLLLADALMLGLIVPDQPAFDEDTARQTARAAIAAVIWVPYMLVSKRVKGTFVH